MKIKNITIQRAEGPVDECDIKYHATSWDEADEILYNMSHSAPKKDEGYDKTDFYITFSDGVEYKGTYDLKHNSVETPSLHSHIENHVLFHAGVKKPYWMDNDVYEQYLQNVNVDIKEYKEFAEKYL